MAGNTSDYEDLVGKVLPQSYHIGFIALSYAVSYLGALTTLELLHRRTSGRGAYNWYLLAGSSLSMGGIGIWCMHYVANRAIILMDANDARSQISYNAGYTTLSFFVPVFVLLAAFSLLGTKETTSKTRIGSSGALAGLAICGMHYLGQGGISNYVCIYDVPHVVGAAIIAVLASITALAVFFALRAAWTNSWWKRATCAIALAGAVSGMHWTAAVGTQYRFRRIVVGSQQNLTAKQTVTMVITFSIVACALLLGLAVLTQHRRAQQSNRAQQVVLACATFDPKGRLMVSPEGAVPCQKITSSYLEQSFEDVFCNSHPVFLWIYRVTRNWQSIVDLIPSMKSHVRAIAAAKAPLPGQESLSHSHNLTHSQSEIDYTVIFRELFCISALSLSGQINEPLEKLGVLYDEILNTGAAANSDRQFRLGSITKDAESGLSSPYSAFGRGQLLFVVRQASTIEAANLQAFGYRFAEVQNVIDILSRRMQVRRGELQMHIEKMRASSTNERILEPGVHLACFAIRACVKGGFDVLVRKDAKNLLPTVVLPISQLSQTELDIIQTLDGMTIATCLKTLRSSPTKSGDKAHVFINQFCDALVELSGLITDPLSEEATLISRPVLAPCRGKEPQSNLEQATLITFRTIVPIQSQTTCRRLEFTPLSLFSTQQQVYKGAPGHDVFTRSIHREFADILFPKDTSSSIGTRNTRTSKRMLAHLSVNPKRLLGFRRSSHSSEGRKSHADNQSWGGILVSQSITVDVSEPESGGVEMQTLGSIGHAMKEEEDVTFVNELIAACVEDGLGR